MKTFIRRPGNKSKHLKHIIHLIPEFTGRYIEPFLGTGAVFLHLQPKKAIINDLNKDIIDIWKLARDEPDYMITEIDKFKKKFLHLNNEEKLIMCKDLVSKLDTLTGKKRTIMYLILTYCSFNGNLILTNRLHFSSINGNIYCKNQCHIFSKDYSEKLLNLQFLKSIKIYNKDYNQILKECKKGDFVFLDPPYIEDKNYAFNYNLKENLNTNFLETLAKTLRALDKKQVKWMMTQIDNAMVRQHFKDYNMVVYENNTTFKSKCCKKELIITNY